jgi:hypothetical protein
MIRRFFHIIIIMLFASQVNAQSFNGTISPSVSVSTVLNLTVTQNIASLNFSTLDQFSNGITVSNYSTVAIKSNSNWNFSVSTSTQYFTATGASASSNMPAAILQMALSTSSTYYTLSTTPQQIKTGVAGSLTESGNNFNVNLKANPGYDYGPGTYSITITYTITSM